MTDRELMQQALDAATEELPKVDERETVFCSIQGHHLRALCEFVRAALTQPEPEPISYSGNGTAGRETNAKPTGFFFQMPKPPEPEPVATVYDAYDTTGIDWHCKDAPATGTKLYTTPPQREWVGLTDEEITETLKRFGLGERAALARAIEAKLKEKNA